MPRWRFGGEGGDCACDCAGDCDCDAHTGDRCPGGPQGLNCDSGDCNCCNSGEGNIGSRCPGRLMGPNSDCDDCNCNRDCDCDCDCECTGGERECEWETNGESYWSSYPHSILLPLRGSAPCGCAFAPSSRTPGRSGPLGLRGPRRPPLGAVSPCLRRMGRWGRRRSRVRVRVVTRSPARIASVPTALSLASDCNGWVSGAAGSTSVLVQLGPGCVFE